MFDMNTLRSENVQITTRDGWTLAGTVYRPETPTIAVLISAGTGFPRKIYRHVASYFAARGAAVLIYDFRGIGDSAPEDLAASGIKYPDWGRHDMPAALAYLRGLAPDVPAVTLGHSIGGQFVGFMENHAQVTRHAFVAVGSGFWANHKPQYWPAEVFFWWIYGPYCLQRYGHIPAGGAWGGEALPPGVFKIWRRWCMRSGYLMPDLKAGKYPHHFEDVTAPISAWVLTDDMIATEAACSDTLSHYPNAQKHLTLRAPSDFGQCKIGHDAAFKRGNEALWAELWDWLAEGALPEGAVEK